MSGHRASAFPDGHAALACDAVTVTVHVPALGCTDSIDAAVDAATAQLWTILAALSASHMWHGGVPPAALPVSERQVVRTETGLPTASATVEHYRSIALRLVYGACVDDEWLLVAAVQAASARCPALRQCPITFSDTDGEFLLIEAAEHLPAWLAAPDDAANRFFLLAGEWRLVDTGRVKGRPARLIDTLQALADAGTAEAAGKAACTIASALAEKLRPYDEYLRKTLSAARWDDANFVDSNKGRIAEEKKPYASHKFRATVPLKLAHVIARDPDTVQLAVEAFYTRDPIGMRIVRRLAKFYGEVAGNAPSSMTTGDHETKPSIHPTNPLVSLTVTTTQTRFAQLASQQLLPPVKLGYPADRAGVLGYRLLAGFELLASDPLYRDRRENNDELSNVEEYEGENIVNSLEGDAGWKKVLQRVTSMGYFENLTAGSPEYKNRLRAFAKQYASSKEIAVDTNSANVLPLRNAASPAFRITSALEGTPPYISESELPQSQPDDESFLEVDPEELEAMLERVVRRMGEIGAEDDDDEDGADDDEFYRVGGSDEDDDGEDDDNISDLDESTADMDDIDEKAAWDYWLDDSQINEEDVQAAHEFRGLLDKLNGFMRGMSGLEGVASGTKEGNKTKKKALTGGRRRAPHVFDKADSDDDDLEEVTEYAPVVVSEDALSKVLKYFESGGVRDDTLGVKQSRNVNEDGEEPDMEMVMRAMDAQLSRTYPKAAGSFVGETKGVAKSSRKNKQPVRSRDNDDTDSDYEEDRLDPVRVDMAAITNLLESVRGQDAFAGPAANLLRVAGVKGVSQLADALLEADGEAEGD